MALWWRHGYSHEGLCSQGVLLWWVVAFTRNVYLTKKCERNSLCMCTRRVGGGMYQFLVMDKGWKGGGGLSYGGKLRHEL